MATTDVDKSRFEAEFPVVTGRPVEILSHGETPDRIALIDGVETGVELTAIDAGSADGILDEIIRLAGQKHESYLRRGILVAGRPFCSVTWTGLPKMSKVRRCTMCTKNLNNWLSPATSMSSGSPRCG